MSEPFLSRIPAVKLDDWKIGHLYRKTPTGYGELLLGEIDNLPDSSINLIVKDIFLLTSGSLTDINRIPAIWRINSGYYKNVDFSKYTNSEVMVPKTHKEKIVQIDNWRDSIDEINFNGSLTLQSEIPSLITKLSVFLDRAYEYDFFVNDKLIKRVYHQEFWKPLIIEFPQPIFAQTIKFKAVINTYSIWEGNTVRNLETFNSEN